jgi:hypothetical protein
MDVDLIRRAEATPVTYIDARALNHHRVMAAVDKLLTPPVFPSIIAWDEHEETHS